MSYNDESFAYDDIGNPTTYRGKTATWAYGRQLTSFDGNTFAYDARGRRTTKNDIAFAYDSNGNLVRQSNGLDFLYDHTGVFAVKYGGSTYFYRKDALGNVVKLLDNSGAVVVEYKYDAWGNCKVLDANGSEISNSAHIGILNPFRYRGYYFDTETNLYFLKTRYYDPEIGRFMTIDDIKYLAPDTVNGLNLYAYGKNNPVMGYDPSGTFDWRTFWDVVITVGSVVAGIVVGFAVSAVAGPVAGFLAGGATIGAINNSVNQIYYEYISDGVSDLTPTSYQDGYINRWDRLDYTKLEMKKANLEHSKYNFNAWMYYSEYNFHMWAWYGLSWADGKDYGIFSDFALRAKEADIKIGNPFYDYKYAEYGLLRTIMYFLVGLLGL